LEIIPLFFCYCLNSGAIWRRRLKQRRFIGTTGYSRKELQNSGVTGYVLKPAECSDESSGLPNPNIKNKANATTQNTSHRCCHLSLSQRQVKSAISKCNYSDFRIAQLFVIFTEAILVWTKRFYTVKIAFSLYT
jgi:hypothetical protein